MTKDYILIELQLGFDGILGNIVTKLENKTEAQAESAWHSVMANAAISALHKHSVLLLNDQGDIIQKGCYIKEANNE